MNGEGRLQYIRASDDTPLALWHWPAVGATKGRVLLFHGFSQNVRTWYGPKQNLPAFLNWYGLEVYALELRGAGASRRAGAPLPAGFGDYLRKDLPAVWETVFSQPTVVIGHSMGGLWALFSALKKPESVVGAVAWASPARLEFPRTLAWAEDPLSYMAPAMAFPHLARFPFPFDWLGKAAGYMLRAGLGGFMDHRDLPFAWGSVSPELMEEHYFSGFDPISWGQVMELIQWHRSGQLNATGILADFCADVRSLQCPVMLISSSGDAVVPPHLAFSALDLPQAPVSTLDGEELGHLDIVLSPKAESLLWPDLVRFVLARCVGRKDSPLAVLG